MANLKSEVAPKGMEFKPTEFVLGGKYSTILTVIAFPRNIAPGFLSDITNIQGVKIAIKHIPIQFSVLQKMLNKEIADLKVRYQSEKEQTMQERKEKFKDEILDIICKGGNIAVYNTTYEPVDCNIIDCGNCLFYGCGCCSDIRIEWYRREYKKPVVISYKDKLFLNFIKEDYKYIARDKQYI